MVYYREATFIKTFYQYVKIGKKWVQKYLSPDFIMHHGIKGQKWGIRNGPPYPLKRNTIITVPKSIKTTAANGLSVTGASGHVIQRISERNVSAENIIDTLRHPLHIGDIKVDANGRPSQRFIGTHATVNVNPESGIIATVWKTGTKTIKKYERR